MTPKTPDDFTKAAHRVPHRVILLLTFLAAALSAECIATLYYVTFDWRDAMLSWAIASYLWFDRRCPGGYPTKSPA